MSKRSPNPYPILSSIPESDRKLYCQNCMQEQPIAFLPESYLENANYYVNLKCLVCQWIITRLEHKAGAGWGMDFAFSKRRTKEAWQEMLKK